METFDMLARECLFGVANKFYAGTAANFNDLKADGTSAPNMTDLRLIVLALKKALVKPRANGRYHVIGSPEFFFDMISDPTVQAYMSINQTTKTMYDNSMLCPMFDMEFYETLCVPTTAEYLDPANSGTLTRRLYRLNTSGYEYQKFPDDTSGDVDGTYVKFASTWIKDTRTGEDGSFIPSRKVWNLGDGTTSGSYCKYLKDAASETSSDPDWVEFKAQHILVVGKDALTRTCLAGEGNVKTYVKKAGSSGVIDPIDQRQSIGFKVNSVGFGSTRLEAIVDYVCVPSQVNPF